MIMVRDGLTVIMHADCMYVLLSKAIHSVAQTVLDRQ